MRGGGLTSRITCTSRQSRNLTLDLAEKKRQSVRRNARSILSRLPRTRCKVRRPPPIWRWFTPGPASATARSSNSKLSQKSRPVLPTAILSSIPAGILCAVISASRRSSPRSHQRSSPFLFQRIQQLRQNKHNRQNNSSVLRPFCRICLKLLCSGFAPVEHDFAGIPGFHQLDRFLKLRVREAMGNNR